MLSPRWASGFGGWQSEGRAGPAAAPPSPGELARRIAPLGLALGGAAAVGALLPLAGSGTMPIGIAALALLPLAGFVLAGPARAAAITAALAYVGALLWAYTSSISPIYAYAGLVNAAPDAGSTLIATALAALPAVWQPLAARRPSTIVLWVIYLMGYVPSIVVPLVMEGDLERVLPLQLALLGSMACLALVARVPLPALGLPHMSFDGFSRMLLAGGILSSLYIVASFGINSLPSLTNVYDTRDEFKGAVDGFIGASYIVPWSSNVINPLLVALGIARRRPGLIALGIAGQVLIYSVGGFKFTLFSIGLVPLVYLALSTSARRFGLLATAAVPVILVAAMSSPFAANSFVGLVSRTFATPAQLTYYYYEYFSVHPKFALSHSFLSGFVPGRYLQEPPDLIGTAYFDTGMHANAGIWADAYANFGFGGILVFTLIFAAALWVADTLAQGRDVRIVGPMMAIAALGVSSGGLFTSLLTNGLGLACLMIMLMPPAAAYAAARRGPRRQPGVRARP